MPEARRHHYVPQFYLKNFVSDRDKPRLFVVDLPGSRSFSTAPCNVAVERDFNTIMTPGVPPDIVETEMSKVEAAIASALARIIAAVSLRDKDDAAYLFWFANLLLVKNPAQRTVFDNFVNTVMTKVGKSYASDQETWDAYVREQVAEGALQGGDDAAELRRAILGDYTVALSTEAHLHTEFTLSKDLFAAFANRGWNLYKATSGQFVTSDRPVVVTWDDPMKTDPVGLSSPGSRVLFALSSGIALCGGAELEDAAFEVDEIDVAKINGRIILNANRQVYARDDNFEYLLQHNPGAKLGRHLADDDFAKSRSRACESASSSPEIVPRP
jgi:hypothetical protein